MANINLPPVAAGTPDRGRRSLLGWRLEKATTGECRGRAAGRKERMRINEILRWAFPQRDPAPAKTDTVAATSNQEIGKDIAGQLKGYEWVDQKEIIEVAMAYMTPWPCHIHRDPRKKAE